MGVAGGFLLGNVIADLVGGKKAEAADPQTDNDRAEERDVEGADDGSGGFDDFEIWRLQLFKRD